MGINVHKFLHVIDQIQSFKDIDCDKPAFEIDYNEINFKKLIENSKIEKKFDKKNIGKYKAFTVGGKSLI